VVREREKERRISCMREEEPENNESGERKRRGSEEDFVFSQEGFERVHFL